MALLLACLLVIAMTSVSCYLDEFDVDYNIKRDNLDNELMQDFYKRLAMINLQDVKRLKTGDIESRDLLSEYRSDNLYVDDGRQEESDDGMKQFVSDKSDIIRDPELTQHSSNFGILQISEAEKQNFKPGSASENIKSEDPLPFYCHPPNPCPKSYASKDGCQEFIEDTAEYQKEWIQQMQRKGICSCDEEHMFDCRSEAESVVVGSTEKTDKFFNEFIKEKEHENPFTQKGQKRQSLVAKKSPRVKRDSKYSIMEQEVNKIAKQSKNNPYLVGKRLPTVAKKGVIKRESLS